MVVEQVYYLNYIEEIEQNRYHDKYLIKEERFMTIFNYRIIEKNIVNTKNGEKEKYIVNFLLDFQRPDITQYIFESFHKHNKNINDNVMEKIRNTEKLFRCFLHNNSMFSP